MINNKPNVKAGDWITVGNTDCVVCRIYDDEYLHDIEVVYSPDKPTNKDVDWVDGKWEFAEEYGGYPDNYGGFAFYLSILKKGKNYWT